MRADDRLDLAREVLRDGEDVLLAVARALVLERAEDMNPSGLNIGNPSNSGFVVTWVSPVPSGFTR